MANRERQKGVRGEREVAAIYAAAGLTVRGLEGDGDHLVAGDQWGAIRVHSEVKRHETARPWAWWEQATAEAPAGSIPVVAFRRNRSPWLAMVSLDDLARLLALAARALNEERDRDTAPIE